MSELTIKIGENEGKYQSSLAYIDKHIVLKFNASDNHAEISRLIGDTYMQGDLLEKIFTIKMKDENQSVYMYKSSIDGVKSIGRFYELQLNQIEIGYKNNMMNEGIIINLPPEQIEGLTKESKRIAIEALECEIVFGYCNEKTTSLVCPKDIQKFVVSLISLYYCFPIEILQEFRREETNNQTKVTFRSQRRSFENVGSRINLYTKANDVLEFLSSANISHPHYMDLPRYARQFIDSYSVSEPQKYNMLFAMLSSFAENIIGFKSNSGEKLVNETVSHFDYTKEIERIETIIKKAGLKRHEEDCLSADSRKNEIEDLAELRNMSEHCLYSDKSYVFLNDFPSVNVFMNDIACRIVLELSGIDISGRN